MYLSAPGFCVLQKCFRDLFIRLNKSFLSVTMLELSKVEQAYCIGLLFDEIVMSTYYLNDLTKPNVLC